MKHIGIYLLLVFVLFGCKSKEDYARISADLIINNIDRAQAILPEFPRQYFVPAAIANQINEINRECDWASRKGKYVDSYTWKVGRNIETNFIYEYFLDCDSLRFILTYNMDLDPPLIKRFNVEALEIRNEFITDPSKGILGR